MTPHRIEALYRLSKVVTSSIKLDKLLGLVLDAVITNIDADGGSILLLDKETGGLRIRASRGLSEEMIKKVHIPIGKEVSGIIAENKKPYLFIDGHFSKEFKGIRIRPRIRSSICVPLLFLNEVIGVLSLNRIKIEKDFTKEDLEMVWLFAAQAAQAISNAIFYEELEKKVRERTAELEEANRRLVELGHVKNGFLDTVSHELRSPLTSIKAYSELLLKEKMEEGRRLEFLKIIDKEAERLAKLIDDLLDLSKIERGKVVLKFRRIDLGRIIMEVLENVRPAADEKGVEMRVSIQDEFPKIKADKAKIIQLIRNLLDNAIKFNHKGGRVLIKVLKKKDHIQVSIKDTGIGIRREDAERIFDRFFQIPQEGVRPRGTGLGLSIAKEIVSQHLGRIWAKSEPGKGTTFYFILPI